MKSVVYFPTFEPPNLEWLKFALLYMESFDPIIPHNRHGELSESYRQVIGETDLIHPYSPHYDQGSRASLKAIEFIEKAKEHRFGYSELFNKANIVRGFSDRSTWKFQIFGEKFTMHWRDYCLENDFGIEVPGGLIVSEDLAFIFMSFLADEISFEEGKSIITDNFKFDSFINYKRIVPFEAKVRNKFAQATISLALPNNISELSLKTLVEFRNTNRELIRAFNIELENAISKIEEGNGERQFIRSFNDVNSELTAEIIAKGVSIMTVPLGFYLAVDNPETSTAQYIKEAIGGLGAILTGRISVRGHLNKIDNRKKCRRYFTNLQRMVN